MPFLIVNASGRTEPIRHELFEGGSVLIGREPDVTALSSEDASALTVGLAPMVISSPSVSANHAAVSYGGGAVHVRDLGSRNGTWLRVPSRGVITAPVGADLRVQLGDPSASARVETDIDDPRYAGRDDYGSAMAASVTDWLARRQIKARVRVSEAPTEALLPTDAAVHVPLASGARLRVEFEQTVDMEVQRSVESLWSWIARQDQIFRAEEETRSDGMILASREIRRAHRVVVESARRGIQSLVFLGPTGAGKERLARAFHRHTNRGGPFVAVNCSMLDRNLARADLFGAELGAYTGCVRARIGAVERAHGGTIFLDEVGDMPPEVQPLLLRFLDEQGEFERMGGDGRLRHADVRVVCATNHNLREESMRGAFRKDLWWRLSVQVVEVPPLHRRFDDVLAYLRIRSLGAVSAFEALHPAALELLRRHPWEGNFRELTNCVLRLPPVFHRHEIDEPTLREALSAGSLRPPEDNDPGSPDDLPSEGVGWDDVVRVAAAAFAEDHGKETPTHWGDVATFIEQYMKPVVVQRMAGALRIDGSAPSSREVSLRLQADSKTIAKHLHRYAERFAR